MKKISIIIPFCNTNKTYISECADSILMQAYDNFEAIFVNDGSVNGCDDILKEYAKKDNRIILINTAHEGAARARQIGIENSTGDLIMFLDSDDKIRSDAFEKIAGSFDNVEVDAVRFNGVTFPSGKIKNEIVFDGKKQIIDKEEIERLLCTTDNLSSLCFQAYRSKQLKNLKFAHRQRSYCEDYAANLVIHKKTEHILLIKDILYEYRDNDASTTKTSDKSVLLKNIKDRIATCTETVDYIKNSTLTEHEKNTAIGFQFERIRGDIAKLFRNGKMVTYAEIESVFKSTEFSSLVNNSSKKQISEYLSTITFRKKLKTKAILNWIYDSKINRIIMLGRMYEMFGRGGK